MASISTFPSRVRAERRELSDSMDRVLEELEHVRRGPDPDNVHDLRVAIRRCRSVATVFEEVDKDPGWPQMRQTARKLFRKLGALRDTHVMDEWIKKLTPPSDPVRVHMHNLFESQEKELSEGVQRAAEKFDEEKWKRLQSHLRGRVRFLPADGLAAECLAWERFEEVKLLHAQALRSLKPRAWHELRIGLKKLRYTVESLLPVHHEAWKENLKRLQDLLGDIHDLDVLSDRVEEESDIAPLALKAWKGAAEAERAARVQTYRQLTLGKTGIFGKWGHALPHGERLDAASFARLRAVAQASRASTRKAARTKRLALRIFDLLRRARSSAVFNDANLRKNLRAAGLLHRIGRGHKRPARRGRRILLNMKLPPRWTRDDWELVAWTVRFYRGAEPSSANGKFSELGAIEQQQIRALAGLLRLARALLKVGVESPKRFRAENGAEALTLLVPDLPDNVESAAKIAAGKHLLETALGKPLVIRAAEKVLPTVEPVAVMPDAVYLMANASD
jgi:CHAD domain-containing protein